MTVGMMMYYGGIAGVGISVLALLICVCVFPGRRKRKLEQI